MTPKPQTFIPKLKLARNCGPAKMSSHSKVSKFIPKTTNWSAHTHTHTYTQEEHLSWSQSLCCPCTTSHMWCFSACSERTGGKLPLSSRTQNTHNTYTHIEVTTFLSAPLHHLKWQHPIAAIQCCSPTQEPSVSTIYTFPYVFSLTHTHTHTLRGVSAKTQQVYLTWMFLCSPLISFTENNCTSTGEEQWLITQVAFTIAWGKQSEKSRTKKDYDTLPCHQHSMSWEHWEQDLFLYNQIFQGVMQSV